jgi:hypothetical protein
VIVTAHAMLRVWKHLWAVTVTLASVR